MSVFVSVFAGALGPILCLLWGVPINGSVFASVFVGVFAGMLEPDPVLFLWGFPMEWRRVRQRVRLHPLAHLTRSVRSPAA